MTANVKHVAQAVLLLLMLLLLLLMMMLIEEMRKIDDGKDTL